MDVTPPDERTDNYNTNHYRTKDEREALTHFDFIKKCLTNDYEEWKKETKNKVYNGKKFIESFNNDMQLEGFPKSEKLIYRLAKYSRHWIERQTEKDKPEPKPPYLKRIVT